jgi:pyrimidine operon attenuation protein/uracil phosphoribosyltransferase
MQARVILNSNQLSLTIERLAHQLIENHKHFHNTAIIGVQPRGVFFADRIHKTLKKFLPDAVIPYGAIDITFYRDDIHLKEKPPTASDTLIEFSVESKKVILIDDVLYTGRTIRAALDAILGFGRPDSIELMALIDRRLHRDVPIQANYIGKIVDSITEEKVKVEWRETDGDDKVWIL